MKILPGIYRENFAKGSSFLIATLIQLTWPIQYIIAYVFSHTYKKNATKSILLIGSNHIGDVLLRSTYFIYFRSKFPDYEIFCTANFSSQPLLPKSLRIQPALISSEKPFKTVVETYRLVKRINPEKVFILERYRYPQYLIPTFTATPPEIISFSHKGFAPFSTHHKLITTGQTHTKYINTLLASYFDDFNLNLSRPYIETKEQDIIIAEAFLKRNHLSKSSFVCIFNTAITSKNLFPIETVAIVSSWLKEQYGIRTLLLGSKSDKATLSNLYSFCPSDTIVCAGEIPLTSLSHVLHMSKFILTPDTGSRHIGNAASALVFFLQPYGRPCDIEFSEYCNTEHQIPKVLGTQDNTLPIDEKARLLISIIMRHAPLER